MSRSARPSIDSLEFKICELYRAELREEFSSYAVASVDSIQGLPDEKLRTKVKNVLAQACCRSDTAKTLFAPTLVIEAEFGFASVDLFNWANRIVLTPGETYLAVRCGACGAEPRIFN
jgi:hypothetical protein